MNQQSQGGNPSISPDLARRLQENFRGGETSGEARPQPVEGNAPGQPTPAPEGERPAAGGGEPRPGVMSPDVAQAIRQLMRANLSQLEAGLTLVERGPELDVLGGRAAILARNGAGSHVVIEFNPEETAMEEMTQALCLMGELQERVQQPVKGILVAKGFPQPVRHAARMVPGLQLKTYSLTLSFGDGAAQA